MTTYDRWTAVVDQIQGRTGDPSDAQRKLASELEIEIPEGTLTLIAAAILRREFTEPLDLSTGPPSHRALELLQDVTDRVGVRTPEPETADEAHAWIDARSPEAGGRGRCHHR